MFDFIEETFDQVSLLVQMVIVFPRFFSVLSGWDHRFCSFLSNKVQEFLRVIRTIRNHPLKIHISNQFLGLSDVMALTTGQDKAQRVAQRIYTGVDLGAEPTPAAPKRLVFLPTSFFCAPAAHGCARTTVLSSRTFSISGSLAKC